MANYIAGRKASKQPANQTKCCDPTSQSRNAPQSRSRDNSNAVSVSGTSVALPFGEPTPSEKPSCEAPPPPSVKIDGSAASPSVLSGCNQDSGDSPAAARLPEGLGNTPKLAQIVGLVSGIRVPDIAPGSMDSSNAPGLGSSTKDGPLSGPAEGAHPPGSLTLPRAGAMGGVAETDGGHGEPDFAETGCLGGSASGDTPPAPASSGGLSSLTDKGSGGGRADITDGLGVPMGLSGLVSELVLPEVAGQAISMDPSSRPGLACGPLSSRQACANPLDSSHLHGAVGGGLGKPDLKQWDNLGGLASGVDLACFLGPGPLAEIGSDLGVSGVQSVGECPAMGGLMEAACAGAIAAAPGVSSISKSFSVPGIFSGQKKGRTTASLSEVRHVC